MHREEENGLGKVGVAGNGSIIQKKQAAKETFPRRVTQVGPGQVGVDKGTDHTQRRREGVCLHTQASCLGFRVWAELKAKKIGGHGE